MIKEQGVCGLKRQLALLRNLDMDFIDEIKHNAEERNVVVWGTGFLQLKCYYILVYNNINAFLISDKHKATPRIRGIPVKGRELLDKDKSFCVTLANDATVRVLKDKGFVEHHDYIIKTDGSSCVNY